MKLSLSILLMLLVPVCMHAQKGSISFQKLGLEGGLMDGTTRCIGQDKYGYIWIGSVGGLNRFDGRKVVQLSNVPGDTTSPYGSQPRCIHSDKNGRLWIGFETGLAEYDFKKTAFSRIAPLKDIFVGDIKYYSDTNLFLATRRGLVRYNPQNGQAFFYSSSTLPGHGPLNRNAVYGLALRNDSLYMATAKGLQILDIKKNTVTTVDIDILAGLPVYSVALDARRNIWIGLYTHIRLARISADLKNAEVYDEPFSMKVPKNTEHINVIDILVDSKDRVWVVCTVDGLLQYMPSSNSFVKHLHQSSAPTSPSANYYRCIFQDSRGLIWLGCDFTGVNFFDPDKNLFKTILPFPDHLDERARVVGRAMAEDSKGNIWMGNHDGVSRYNPVTNTYTIWRNDNPAKPVLYNNVVRTMYCDREDNIWIGTSDGVNRYNSKTGVMEFIDYKDLPAGFYNSITEDRSGNIWFCLNAQTVLYWYSLADKKYHGIGEHPQLAPYMSLAATSYVMEDSKQRLWISFTRKGMIMLDKKTGKVRHYIAPNSTDKGIIGDIIVDIKEDKDGIIWMASFNGITGIDVEKDTYLSFNNKNGLPGNRASPLAIDSLNRVWIGVNGGLAMLHPDRKTFTVFFENDGLPSIGFPEHASIQTANGDVMMATYNGYIRFNPDKINDDDKSPMDFYLSEYSVFDKKYALSPVQTQPELALQANENSFTFNLVALNFTNPSKTWFAYKLDGFEKEWHYTQDAKAVYTNIPGGHYTFLYKASLNKVNWDTVTAKSVVINLDSFFYKTVWFWLLMLALLLSIFYLVYRYRIHEQRKMFHLKTKADSLEKEKTLIQYESLKQHLNPHFLFNSLTSLRSLIKTDASTAARFLDGMSKVYRYVLKSGDMEMVPLKDEVEFVKTFADLQQVRFGEGLQIAIQISEEHLGRYIVPVVLQNLVENAIKHNTAAVECPLHIDIFSEGGYLVVRNNLQRYREVETSNKSGLKSLKKLYSFYTDQEMVITEDDEFFTVRIPLL